MKITDKLIAEEFGTTVQTLNNWKNGSAQHKKRYYALKNALIEDNMLIWEVSLRGNITDYRDNSGVGSYSIDKRDSIKSMRIYNG